MKEYFGKFQVCVSPSSLPLADGGLQPSEPVSPADANAVGTDSSHPVWESTSKSFFHFVPCSGFVTVER